MKRLRKFNTLKSQIENQRGLGERCEEEKMVRKKEEEGIDWWNDFGSEAGEIGYEGEESYEEEDNENGG